MQEKNGTIEELFKEFGLDCDTMEVGVPYDVHESDIEIEAFDEKLNKKDIKNYWITHKSIYLIQLKEEELYHYVLSYNVNKY